MTTQTKLEKKPKIILDTNALFIPLQFKIDLFEEIKKLLKRNFEPILLSPTQKELEKIATDSSTEMRKKAQFAIKLAEKCTILEIPQENALTDDLIVKTASKHKYAVLTNDRQLRHRLRDINVPVIYVRQKSRLEMDGRL